MHPDPETGVIQQRPARPIVQRVALDDAHLWDNVTRDNALAFSVLYKKYTQKLFNFGMHVCHDHDLVVDCMQELFTILWSRRHELTTIHSVNAYLFRSFRRLLIKRISWRRRFMMSMPLKHPVAFEVMPPVEDDIVDVEESERWRKRLNAGLMTLTRRQREAIFLKFYNDLTYEEIASVMEVKVDSIYNVISKALDMLRRAVPK